MSRPIRAAASPFAVFRSFQARIPLTYLLTLLENVFELLYPWATGVAINGLLEGSWRSLASLVAVWFAHVATGAARQVYDMWLFGRVNAALSTETVMGQREAGAGTTEVAARAAMAGEFADFFERDLPVFATAVVGLVGAVGMLFFYDPLVGLAAAGLLVPVCAINAVYGRHALALNRRLNDRLEREVAVVSEGSREEVRAHFLDLARWRFKLSNAEAANWSLVEIFAVAVVVLVLIRTTGLPGIQAGDIYAVLAYLFGVLGSLDEVPFLVQQAGRLIDIRRRLTRNEQSDSEEIG